MTKSEIVRMAEEAGMMCDENVWFSKNRFHIDVDMADLERFANLVAAAEREECAKEISAEINDEIEDEAYCILVALLARIRARG